jgi:hypothetical protein
LRPCQFGSSGGQVNFDRDGRLTSAAAALAMKSIDRFARQSLTAGPFSRELRAPYREGVFQPLFWRLPIADATSARALFSWSWVDVPKAGVRGLSLLRVPERCMKAAFSLHSCAGQRRWNGFNGNSSHSCSGWPSHAQSCAMALPLSLGRGHTGVQNVEGMTARNPGY